MQIDGVILTPLNQIPDARGWLMEVWRADESEHQPAMGYVSLTKPGVVRGPHEHVEQADWFVFLTSQWRVTLWDNRGQSSLEREALIINVPISLLVPAGVVHAYENIGQGIGLVLNLPDKLYAGWNRKEPVDEIRHEETGRFNAERVVG